MKYIEILDKVNKDSYFELGYKLTVEIPTNLQLYYSELTVSKSGILSCNLTDTVATIKTKLLKLWSDYNSEITNNTQWKYYGSYYDGTNWVLGGTL